MQWENRIVLVTGANRGIGKSLVEALLSRGVKKIYATSRNLGQMPVFNDKRVVNLELDITNQEQVLQIAKEASDTEVLINNAGVISYSSLFDGPMEPINNVMDTNYYGTLNMMRAFIPVLEKNDSPVIANVASMASFVNLPSIGGYCASKAALFSLTQGARIELAPKGIAVHSVNPGPIDTDMGSKYDGEKTTPEETAENILNGLEKDEADIFPDRWGKGMFNLWNKNYRDLENMMAESFHAEKK